MDFGRLLERSAAKYPDKTAIVYRNLRLSYREMERRSNCLAHAMKALPLQPFSRIGIISANSHRYLEFVFACAKAGFISTHFNWRLKEQDICALIDNSEVQVIFISTQFRELIPYLRKNIKRVLTFVAMDESIFGCLFYEDLLEGQNEKPPPRNIKDDDVLMQIYTSGTTRLPKGVMLTHKNVVTHAMSNALESEHLCDTVFQFLMPMFHVAASAAFCSVLVGGTLVLFERFVPEEYAASIEREKVTMIGAPPTVVAKLIDEDRKGIYDLSSLKTIIYGSAPMPPAIIVEAVKRFHCRFVQYFGMTEMSPTICTLGPWDHIIVDPEYPPKRLFSVGKACIGAAVKVIDKQGVECASEQIGEIITCGDHMMKGYFKMPEETARLIVDGWYWTGDMGYFDEEGYLYLAGRKSDMIISGGENIYPNEVEDCIMELTNDVEEAAVIAVSDNVWGELVQAVVVRRQGSDIDEAAIIGYCKNRIASYKKPQKVDFVESLPKDHNGKLLRRVLRDIYRKKTNQDADPSFWQYNL